jgi:hypothetical protein
VPAFHQKYPPTHIKTAGDLASSAHHPSHSYSHFPQHYKTSLMQRALANYELYHPHSTWSKLGSPNMSRSGKGKAVDRGAQQSSREDDYSDDEDEYDDDDWKQIEDPSARRKIQNRLAQRKFRKSQSFFQPHLPTVYPPAPTIHPRPFTTSQFWNSTEKFYSPGPLVSSALASI